MRKRFPEYFNKPDIKKIKKMWKTAIFVPDTNVLLDIFRFPPESSEGLLKILKHLKDQDRLWIPYQFAHEYLKELPRIKYDIREDNKKRMKVLNQWSKNVVDKLNEFDDLTDYELGEKIANIKSIFKAITEGLREHGKKHEERLEDLKGEIDKLFADRIGAPYNDQKLAEIYGEGEWRYKLRRPPGFKDENKPVSWRYGDLVGWLQIIEFAGSQDTKQPIIMITRDSSGGDWFYKPEVHKDKVAPRPELVKEMRNKAGVDFYLYQTGEFMELANEHLELDDLVPETAIEEAKARKHDGFRSQFLNRYPYIDEELRKFVAPISPFDPDKYAKLLSSSDPDMYAKLFPPFDPLKPLKLLLSSDPDMYAKLFPPFDPLKPLKLLSSSDPDMYAKLFPSFDPDMYAKLLPPFDPDMYAKLLPPFDYGSRPPNVDNIDDDLDMSDETQDDNVDDNDDHEPPPSPDDDKSI